MNTGLCYEHMTSPSADLEHLSASHNAAPASRKFETHAFLTLAKRHCRPSFNIALATVYLKGQGIVLSVRNSTAHFSKPALLSPQLLRLPRLSAFTPATSTTMGNAQSLLLQGQPNILSSTAGFSAIYFAAHYLLRNLPQLGLSKGVDATLASSRVASFVHSVVTTYAALPHAQTPADIERDAEKINTPFQNNLIQFSVGYFVADLLNLLLFERDPMFIIHHLISLNLLLVSRWSAGGRGTGGTAPMVAFFIGEFTTPLQNLWWLFKRAGNDRVANAISPVYTALFLLCRCVLLPMYVIPVSVRMLLGTAVRPLQPFWARVWGAELLFALLGGFVWAKSLLKGYLKVLHKP